MSYARRFQMTRPPGIAAAILCALALGAGCGSSPDRVCNPIATWSATMFTCAAAAPVVEDSDVPNATVADADEAGLDEEDAVAADDSDDLDTASDIDSDGLGAGDDSADADDDTDASDDTGDALAANDDDDDGDDSDADADDDDADDALFDDDDDDSTELVTLADNRIEVLGAVEFESSTATLTDDSQAILDQMVTLLNDNPDIRRVTIEVRTNVGNRRASKKLAKKRARALRKYLTGAGVKRRRVKAKGYRLRGAEEAEEITFKVRKKRSKKKNR